MKKVLAMFSIVALSMVYACKPSVEPLAQDSVDLPLAADMKQVVYQNVKVNVRADFPEQALNPASLSVYVAYLKGISESKARLAASELPNLSGQYILELLQEAKKQYPDLSNSPIDSKDLKMISKNFPSVKTEEDVWKNHDVIFDFYNDLIREDALRKALKGDKPKANGGRLANFEPMDLLAASPIYALWVGWPFIWMQVARSDADHRVVTDVNNFMIPTNESLPIDNASKVDNERGNAFRHSVWNALGVKYMIDAGVSKTRALEKMRDVATTYEAMTGQWGILVATNDALWNNPQQAFDNVPQGNNNAMDLHNNMVGRTYMEKNTSWGIFGLRRMPSYSEICDELRNRSNTAIYRGPLGSSPDPIYLIYDSGNAANGFYRLKWWGWDNFLQPLTFIEQ